MTTVLTQPCVLCGKSSTLEVTEDERDRYINGEKVQDVFPHWTPEQRELLISGSHPECWDAMFPEEDE